MELKLQAHLGQVVMTSESPFMVTFVAQSDGVTILCYLQYVGDYPAAAVEVRRKAIQASFAEFRQAWKADWLKLEFKERIAADRWLGR